MYRIIIEDKALKGLSKIPKPHNSRIVKAIDALAKEPYPAGCKKLKSRNNQYRIRIGDYRVIYNVKNAILTILVLDIGNRKNIYQ